MANFLDDEGLLEEMREAFKDHDHHNSGDDLMDLDTNTFKRYLNARKGDVAAAKKMLEETLTFRKEFGLGEIFSAPWLKTLEKETFTGKTYCRGYDREGRSILYMKPRYENTHEHDGNLKNLVYNLERCVASMKKANGSESKEKLVLLIDFAGYSTLNSPPMKTSRATLSILQNHYPERLHAAYCIRAPWLFNAFFKLISPFIDPVTAKKINFLSGSVEEIGTQLTSESGANIDMEQLEADLGGKDRILYDGGVYLGLSEANLASNIPAVLGNDEKLPHLKSEKLPDFKSALRGEEAEVDTGVLEKCKAVFSLTYKDLLPAVASDEEKEEKKVEA